GHVGRQVVGELLEQRLGIRAPALQLAKQSAYLAMLLFEQCCRFHGRSFLARRTIRDDGPLALAVSQKGARASRGATGSKSRTSGFEPAFSARDGQNAVPRAGARAALERSCVKVGTEKA